jgi:predicted transcriptional regulator
MLFNSGQQAENKLIILYVLKKIKTSLTREQISLIVIENLQISYFDIQIYIDDLIENEFLSMLDFDGKSVLTITPIGKETLKVFQNKISSYIMDMIDLYLKENREKIFKEVKVTANYQKIGSTDYLVELKLHENNVVLMEISLNAPTVKLALDICERWKENTQELYASVLKTLT